MTRLTLLFLLAALVVSGTASARPAPDSGQATPAPIDARGTDVAADFRARGGEPAGAASAQERYYASYGEPEPLQAAAPAPAVSDAAGPSWLGTLGIGLGLIVIAGGLGVYAGRTVRPRGVA